jgi:hypothetical protein
LQTGDKINIILVPDNRNPENSPVPAPAPNYFPHNTPVYENDKKLDPGVSPLRPQPVYEPYQNYNFQQHYNLYWGSPSQEAINKATENTVTTGTVALSILTLFLMLCGG